MDPRVKDYLMKKQMGEVEETSPEMPPPPKSLYEDYDSKYGDTAMAQAEADAADQKSNLGWTQFAAGMGDALAGRDPSNSAKNFQDIRKGIDDSTIGSLERRKAGAMKNVEVKKSLNNSDPNSKESLNFRKMMESQFPKVAAQYGDSWANVSAADQDNIFKPLQLKETVEARKQAAALMAGEKQAKLDEKRELKNQALAVPGFERTGEVMPKEEEAAKFRKATAVSKQLSAKLDRMKQLVAENGSFEYGGNAGTEMESLATEIQLLGKSPELYELGVLAGPDLNLLQKITADPTSLDSLFTRDSSRQKQLDSQITSIKSKLGTTASSLGYRPAGGQDKTMADEKTILKTQTNQKTGAKRIVYSDGSVEEIPSVAGGR